MSALSHFIFGFPTTHFSSGRITAIHSREIYNEVRWKILSCLRYEFNPSFLSCETIFTEGKLLTCRNFTDTENPFSFSALVSVLSCHLNKKGLCRVNCLRYPEVKNI